MMPLRRWLAWVSVSLGFLSLAAQTNPPVEIPEGAAFLKTDILGVFAHPDDETGAATTLAYYALEQGKSVSAVYCTRGEGGGNAVGTQSGPALGILRESELRTALTRLGVRSAWFLDAEDFAYTEDLLISLEKWNHLERLERLVRLVRTLRPEVILTQDPAPRPGQHGNHQAAGVLAIEAFDAAADPDRFPDQLTHEGLSLWRPRKLYWSGARGTGSVITPSATLPDGRLLVDVVASALSAHRSQGFGRFTPAPWMRAPQSWILVKSTVPFVDGETNFFRDLPISDPAPDRLLADGDDPQATELDLRFRSRPAVETYFQVCREQKIQHAAQAFSADLPVVAGEASDVELWVANPTLKAGNADVHVSVPPGWQATSDFAMRFSPSRTNIHRIWITPPRDGLVDGEVSLTARVEGHELHAKARLHPVPHLSIPTVTVPLVVDAMENDPAWLAVPSHEISSTNVWEGTVRDAADSSATFRVAHDAENLYFEIQVRDDHVVSNLAPQDIRAHWRTDSVELCIDPAVASPHTLHCFKLGIVPFDTSGHVGAARDADARPGPVAETSPGTHLFSWRTPGGYGTRAVIPLSETGIAAGGRQRIGLNVLVYDADQPGAKVGDNVGKSRIAWAPRSGVQGRPEDWGRADMR
jgi:LmbE family N-acetylglucosaminyl deacetylase